MSRSHAFLLLLVVTGRPVAAQPPAQRTLVEAFRDSLARSADPAALSRLEGRMVLGVRGNRGGAVEHLRLGYLALRLGELGTRRYYEDAASEFQWVARVEPAWPFAWYGLGLAEYGIAQGEGRGVPTPPGLDRAARALARAIQADARFADRILDEGADARYRHDAGRSLLALEALRLAGRVRQPVPSAMAALGRVERDVGDARAALRAFEAWLPASGRLRGLALLELARTRFLLGRTDGAGPYFDGAVFDDTLTVRHFRDDIALIASETELREFDRTSGSARADFLRRFWRTRDIADLRADGERLREHYRRVYYARRTFPLHTPGRSRALDQRIAGAEPGMDDRGIVVVRHGEPDDRVVMSTLGVEPNESWRYARDEGDLVLHFVARHDPEVYRLVESLFDVAETMVPQPGSGGVGVTEGQEMLLRSREPLAGFYGRRPRATARPEDFRLAERALSRSSLVAATTTDDFRPRYVRSLGLRVDPVLFESRGDGTALHLAFALPFDSLGAAWLGPAIEYPVRLRLAAFDLEGRPVARIDSTVRPVTAQLAAERWLAGTVSLTLPSGRLRLRVAVEDGDTAGSVTPLRSLEVGTAMGVSLSDLAVGELSTPWRVDGVKGEPLSLAPLGRLRRGEPAELAYLVRAPGGSRLRAELSLARIDADPGVAISRRRQLLVPEGELVIREPLETRKLKPGLYRVEVTLLDGRGGLARRWREFEVVDPRPAR
jgi:GWxTD domain-containing protein